MENKTEISIPSQLQDVIVKSNISDLSKSEKIASNYAPIMEEVNEQITILKTLTKGNLDDVEKAKRIRIDLGKIASKADRQKKADKDLVLLEGRFIDALFNTVNNAARITQNEAEEIEKYFIEQERKRIQQIEDSRRLLLSEFTEIVPMGLSTMDDVVFNTYLEGVKVAYFAKIEAEKIAEEERIAKEKAEQEAREFQRLENERLKAEADKREREIEAERKENQLKIDEANKLAKQQAQKIAKENEQRLIAERKEREKIEAELNAKKEAEFKAEQQRLSDELKVKRELEKIAKSPIKKQLSLWVDSFQIPDISAENQIKTNIEEKFIAFKKWAKSEIEKI